MQRQITSWFTVVPLTDPAERGLGRILQIVLIGFVGVGMLLFLLLGLLLSGAPTPPSNMGAWTAPILLVAGLVFVTTPVIALVLLRRGAFHPAVLVTALGFAWAHGSTMLVFSTGDAEQLPLFFLPIILAGLLGRRRELLLVAGLIVIWVFIIWILTAQFAVVPSTFVPQQAALPPPRIGWISVYLAPFTLTVGLMVWFFSFFSQTLRVALVQSLARERELNQLRVSLEEQVVEQTTELREALNQSRTLTDAQARLLEENTQQRAIMREMSVPVLPVNAGTLVIPLVGILDAERLQHLQQQALYAVEHSAARRVLLDITGVPVVDAAIAEQIIIVMQATRLLGAEIMLVGVRPEVAQSIVGLGIDLQGIKTYRDLQSAIGQRA